MAFTFAISYTIVVNFTQKSMWIYVDVLTDIAKLLCIKTLQIHILLTAIPDFPTAQVIGISYTQSVDGEARACISTSQVGEKFFELKCYLWLRRGVGVQQGNGGKK